MSSSADHAIPPDELAALAPRDVQLRAARMVQDAFAQVFRLSVEGDEAAAGQAVTQLTDALSNWTQAGADEEARALRLAMLVSGLDQWGVAWSRAFGLQAIPALSALVGGMRTALDAGADARFGRQFAAIDAGEGNLIDFKIDLRRSLHLALWHSMIACEDKDEAEAVAQTLGGMLLGLTSSMPQLGWRLVADALSHMQIRCLADSLATEGLARETNEALFAALARELPPETRDLVFAHSAEAVRTWLQSGRGHIH
ncbi:MAG: hypothetical protein LPJ87_03965 [Zoogloeaceae bacterium]|nr:hypothetical protein [Zoogloeaceae bacterium]